MTRKTEMAATVQASLAETHGWARLDEQQKQIAREETRALAGAIVSARLSTLAMGQHLSNLQEILEPQRIFNRVLETFLISKRTAYRYIEAYRNLRSVFPENVMRVAIERGFDFSRPDPDRPLGVYTEIIKQLPPPKTDDQAKIEVYISKVLEERRKANRRPRILEGAVDRSTQSLLRETYRFAVSRFRMLPKSHRVRSRWLFDLVGMMLTELGVSSPHTFEPTVVPRDFPANPIGRPRLKPKDRKAD